MGKVAIHVSCIFRSLCLLIVFNGLTGHAQVVAIRSIVGGNDTGSVAGFTYGWKFTLAGSSPLAVTHLGLLDMHASGFLEAHRAGLWDSGGSLLAEAAFDAGESGALENGFRYLSLNTPAVLQPGQTYSIGSWNLSNSDNAITGAHFTTEYSDEIIFEGAAYSPTSGFEAPQQNVSLSHGYFGPNFKFLAPVPEPQECLMFTAAGLAAFGALRRLALRI